MSGVIFKGVEKIFGPKPDRARAALREGDAKARVFERTGHSVALSDVNLSIEAGDVCVVMGRSGSGKSTLLRLINRLIEPTGGDVTVLGVDVGTLSQAGLRAFRQSTVSMVFQNFGLMPHLNVRDNIALPLTFKGLPKKEARDKAEPWVARVGLAGYGDTRPSSLSSGMRQRVGLARAFIAETPILLMDEPFAALDPLTRHDMQAELLKLKADFNKTVIMISHDPTEAARMATRVAILHDGRLVQTGTWASVAAHPASDEVAAFVSAAR